MNAIQRALFTAIWLGVLLPACDTASQTMQSYVGISVEQVMLKEGPPINVFDMPDGRRVFQWTDTKSYTSSPLTNTTGYVDGSGTIRTTAITTGGRTHEWDCLYSLYAVQSGNSENWVITGFEDPGFSCE